MKAAFAIVLVGALAYVVWMQVTAPAPGENRADSALPPPEPDTESLAALKDVATVNVAAVLSGSLEYDLGGRNLFQYGPPKPPPPSAAELEAMRKAEEDRLKALEQQARARADDQEKQLKEANERRAVEAADAMKRIQEQQKVQQVEAKKVAQNPPPPPINFKLIGWLGPPQKRIAVFLNGSEMVLGRLGDVLDGKYKVLSMGTESVEMGYIDPAHKDAKKRIEMGS